MTVIKICGITNLSDARVAVDAGADALGFNFYRPSPRYLPPSVAREIIDQVGKQVMTVGVFVNEPSPEVVQKIAQEADVTAVQLHGDESPDYCAALSNYFVIKALSAAGLSHNEVVSYDVSAVMIDAGSKQLRGGTGRVVDWTLATRIKEVVPKLFLAGGLSSKNVADAILTVRPYGIDACSALEREPGRKNHDEVRAFIEKARGVKP